ncbi:hypothetical protein [Dyadobacter bucti]|uniref:hypothetical protein n=1 Tax=Dyadobacter bucti TaxID=2572203 RepID=UPI003F6ED814
MVKKHFTLRLTVASFLAFLSLVFASFSCQDHEVPEVPEQPATVQINTLNISGNVNDGFSYSVQFSSLGSIPIVEYGIVTFAGEPGDVKVPTIEILDQLDDRKYAFTGAGYMPPSLAAKTITRAYDGPTGDPVRLFYRAYAILNNSTVVYGELKFIDFALNVPGQINPVIKTLDASKGDDSDFIAYALQFESLGNISVAEYGIVTYQGKPNDQQTPEVPTDNPLEKKYPYAEAVNLDVKNIIKQYDGPTDGPIRLFYRAYATLNNGEVVYGEVKFLDFEIEVKPIIETRDVSFLPPNPPTQVLFQLELELTELGNIPIVEYGFIFAGGQVGEIKNPTLPVSVLDTKVVLGTNPNLGGIITTLATGQPVMSKRYFFRAYISLDTGEVIYGETKFIDYIVP